MDHTHDLLIQGIPDTIPEHMAAVCRSRFLSITNDLLNRTRLNDIKITIGTASLMQNTRTSASTNGEQADQSRASDEPSIEERAHQYKAERPLFTFDQLVVPDSLLEALLSAVAVIQVERTVFHTWGLKAIEPFPRTALNFHGAPGTGKTLAAHAIAQRLGRAILVASYAEIESKFHGDGPKNVKAIFYAAQRDNAILFIDEADSLLSKRLTNVSQGSEQAINSMRSQLLICLQQFRGIVIFATNLVENYDKAFETRMRNLHFPMPDEKCRREIWKRLLVPQLPLADDVSFEQLATYADDLCGRDIKNVIINTAIKVARYGKDRIAIHDFFEAIEQLKAERITTTSGEIRKLSLEEEVVAGEKLQAALFKGQVSNNGTTSDSQ